MKKILVLATVAATGVIIYALLKKKYNNPHKYIQTQKKPKHDKHQLTHAFANAKRHSLG